MSGKKLVRVRNIMRTNFLETDGLKTVKEAIEAMEAANTDLIMVKRRSEDDEYGVVLLSDVAKKILAEDKAPERISVYQIMQKPVICVSPDMDIRYCARLFDRFQIDAAPVIQDHKAIGIVTYRGLAIRGLLEMYA